MMSEALHYRPVETGDLDTLCKLPRDEEELFFMFPKAQPPLTTAQLQGAIASRSDSTVFLLDGQIAGFANFYAHKDGEFCSLGNVIVNPQFRKQGVGEYVIRTMEKLAVERHGAKEIRIPCCNTNTRGLFFYTKLGYTPFAIEEATAWDGRRHAFVYLKRGV